MEKLWLPVGGRREAKCHASPRIVRNGRRFCSPIIRPAVLINELQLNAKNTLMEALHSP